MWLNGNEKEWNLFNKKLIFWNFSDFLKKKKKNRDFWYNDIDNLFVHVLGN